MKRLDSLSKRDLLASAKFDPNALREYAEDYFAQERFGEAFEFFQKIGDKEGVRRVKGKAIESADPELLWRIEHADSAAVTREDWTTCGDNAMRLAKHRSAEFVFKRIGDADKLAAAEKEFAPAPQAEAAKP